jgi:hypothetical protein
MSATIAPQKPQREKPQQEKSRLRKAQCEIFLGPEGSLFFVLTEEMWRVHDASKIEAIIFSARLKRTVLKQWKKRYGDRWEEVRLWIYKPWTLPGELDRHFPEGLGKPTKGLLACRRKARPTSIGQATEPPVPHRTIYTWLENRKNLKWYEGWLVRGEDPPPNVTLATQEQIRQAREVWDYVGHCQNAEISPRDSYCQWIIDGRIPNLDWLHWLFGAPPPKGVYVVPLTLQDLQEQGRPDAICKATGLRLTTFGEWIAEGLEQILHACLQGREQDLSTNETWQDLPTRTKNEIRRYTTVYAKGASLPERLKRVYVCDSDELDPVGTSSIVEDLGDGQHLSRSKYEQLLRDAECDGAREDLERYLDVNPLIHRKGHPRSGLVAGIDQGRSSTPRAAGDVDELPGNTPKLYVPTEGMFAFREMAVKAGGSKKWPGPLLDRDQELLDLLFLAWSMPPAAKGRQCSLWEAHTDSGRWRRLDRGDTGDQVPAEAGQAERQQADAPAMSEEDPIGETEEPVRRGRRRTIDAIAEFCYTRREARDPWSQILEKLQQYFGPTAPKDKRVIIYTSRWAKANKKPWPIPRLQN